MKVLKNILIIEDEMIIAMDIAQKIKSLGYHPMKMISHSEKAIDFLSFNTPDLVLCDIMIKGNRSGIEIAEIISKKYTIPFIYLTSLSDKNTLDQAKKTLPYGYIVKPFTISDLSSSIEMALYKFQQELDNLILTMEKINEITESKLSIIEFDYLKDITKGLSNSQLAEKYFVSVNTVKSHVKNIMKKLNCQNRIEIAHVILNLFKIQR